MQTEKCRMSNMRWYLHGIKVNIWHVVASLVWRLQTFKQQPQISVCCRKIALGYNLDWRSQFFVTMNFRMEQSLKKKGTKNPKVVYLIMNGFFLVFTRPLGKPNCQQRHWVRDRFGFTPRSVLCSQLSNRFDCRCVSQGWQLIKESEPLEFCSCGLFLQFILGFSGLPSHQPLIHSACEILWNLGFRLC